MSKKVNETAYGSAVGYGNNHSSTTGPVSYSTWQNKVFRASHKSLTDLGSKGNGENTQKPNNDYLDGFEVGDTISGIGKTNQVTYQGNISAIVKDSDGEGVRIYIISQKDGRVELSPSSIEMITKKGGRSGAPRTDGMIPPGEERPDTNPYSNFDIEENVTPLKNLKSFKEFV